jgi:hypothetical protein
LKSKDFIITGTGETEMSFTSVGDIAGFTAHILTSMFAVTTSADIEVHHQKNCQDACSVYKAAGQQSSS